MAEIEARLGQLSLAHADASEAVQLARDVGQMNFLTFALVTLARVDALRGQDADCRDETTEALALAETLGVGSIATYVGAVRGLSALGGARADDAVAELEPLSALTAEQGVEEPNMVPWRPDLIEAYIRCGRRADAERELAELERQGRGTGDAWAAASALRCRGLLADSDRFAMLFADALVLHETGPLRIDHARTQLCFGERLRRAGQRTGAREQLRKAFDTFERTGARPWAELARRQLVAAGGRQQRRLAAEQWTLSPQELQVARVVAAGATNAEAAAQLFLSPKTVEKHLTATYRKLGLRSRSELAARFSA